LTEIIQKLRELSGHLVDPDIAIAMFEQLPDAIIVVDSAGVIQLVNRQAEFMFGWHRSELFDKPIETLIPEASKDKHVRFRSDFMMDPRTRPMGLNLPLRARRKDGDDFPVEINLSPISTKPGLLVMAVIRRKRVESAS
jgi:protein-histidine pros-kinase